MANPFFVPEVPSEPCSSRPEKRGTRAELSANGDEVFGPRRTADTSLAGAAPTALCPRETLDRLALSAIWRLVQFL